ncbi:Uncharacterised protein [Chlamydia trachomatis]|nr:Uncharacterised protein [Chlamydia trachomatis]
MGHDLFNAGCAHDTAKASNIEQQFHIAGQRPVSVNQFLAYIGCSLGRRDRRDLAVYLQAQTLTGHIVLRNVGINAQIHPQVALLFRSLATIGCDRIGDHPHIQVEANPFNMTGLSPAQQVAGTSNL